MDRRALGYRCTLWLLGCLVAFLALGCGAKKEVRPPPADPRWSEHIASHSAGSLPRATTLTLRFSHPVVAAGLVGKNLDDGYLEIEPSIAGALRFVNESELQFKPGQALKPGQDYAVRLLPGKLQGLPAGLTPYAFGFRVLEPDYELKIGGLDAAADGGPAMKLGGSIETADAEEGSAVEKMLKARFEDQDRAIEWVHFNEGRSHHFTVSGITRRSAAGLLKLSWNGEAIRVKTKGERELEVPALGLFAVSDVAVVQEERRQALRVSFSELLDASQNLKGLVKLGKVGLSTRVDGNALLVYPDEALSGEVKLEIAPGVRSAKGQRLKQKHQATVSFASEKPQVRFVGKGVILPDNPTLAIPFEAINAHSVQVTAMQVYDNRIGQFLQNNKLDGTQELHRVGRYLWRKTIPLSGAPSNQWNRYTLDATELLRAHPGSLFRLTLSINRGNALQDCPASGVPALPEEAPKSHEDIDLTEHSSWDYAEDYYGGQDVDWSDRDDSCKDAYYRYAEGVKDERNFLASNIGLIAKRGASGGVDVIVTRLHDAAPLDGAKLELRNFQDQVIAQGQSNASGFATLDSKGTPFYLVARAGGQVGYLKLSRGSALPVSHFDVGGETVSGGIKGLIYGERGVWRPGDDIHLGFILQDRENRIPDNHPVTLQLLDPRGQLVLSQTQKQPLGDFYRFTLKTAEDAPTGNWTARALLGGAEFSKTLKIETVMPNRLKLELSFADEKELRQQHTAQAALFGQWLHGASAAGLKADVAVKLTPVPTRFSRYGDFSFEDPTRQFSAERQTVMEEKLDAEGRARFGVKLESGENAPGLLQATFTSRVFEDSGAFSTSVSSFPYHAYPGYVGLKLPKGDAMRGMLLTDQQHPLEIATVDTRGEPSSGEVQVTLYKIAWKWWWESQQDGAEFSQNSEQSMLREETIRTQAGRAIWKFEVKYPDWGRYMIRACDKAGGHCASRVFYMDWPGWAGRAQEESGPGASTLQFLADKTEYSVGETATLQLPEATQGRALLSIENGSRLIEKRWVALEGKTPKVQLPITAEMAPNVYASITLVQPHQGKNNDRPIRLYGMIPLKVRDPATVLRPQIRSAELWRPNGKVSLEVSEAAGRAMTYTVAVVDEGLLGLTAYKTPDPREHFYKREALGVTTWDLYDDVAGAYGSKLERLLALGGDSGGPIAEQAGQKRFPPVVRFIGPFQLKAGATAEHEIALPQYIGAVRIMVVAGEQGAYGSAEKTVTVREPVSVLATLPRVLGPGEELSIPVSVFAYEQGVGRVELTAEAGPGLKLVGKSMSLDFNGPGERMATFTARVEGGIGRTSFTVRARSGRHSTQGTVNLEIRPQNPLTLELQRKDLEPGQEWRTTIRPHGVAGTNRVTLEVSALPPFDLERRLAYLIQYPHGCVEQLTSATFPQLYLDRLVRLSPQQRKDIERNVAGGIERLRRYQMADGGFSYWPGNASVNAWANNYAGHFLVEARKAGYHVPAELFDAWLSAQRALASSYSGSSATDSANQAYRLYTLALADKPDVAAMNRLRETRSLEPMARWQLASAYAQVGLGEAGADIAQGSFEQKATGTSSSDTFGSPLRDRAIALTTLVALKDARRAETYAHDLAKDLSSGEWYSTQSTAYALLAMARHVGAQGSGESFTFAYALGGGKPLSVTVEKQALYSERLAAAEGGERELVLRNDGKRTVHVTVVAQGSPPPGNEKPAAEGLELSVQYLDTKGRTLDPAKIAQGTDFVARVTVANRSGSRLADLALAQPVPSGWEIHNPRFESDGLGQNADSIYQDVRDDRVNTYFTLDNGETRSFNLLLNASYQGRHYLPAVSVESMYDARRHAHSAGQWTTVVK